MPQTTKSRKFLLYTFIIVQVLLNVTFSSAAVIRREKREIAANVTANSNNELDSATATNNEDEESSLFQTGPSGIGTTTGKSLSDTTTIEGNEGKKDVTTLKGSTIDENTVSFDLDDEESDSDSGNEENIVESNIDQNTTIESRSETTKAVLKEETSTVDGATVTLTTDRGSVVKQESSVTDEDTPNSTTDIGSVVKEETSVTDEGTLHSTIAAGDTRTVVETESTLKEEPSTTVISPLSVKADETTSQMTVDSATISAVDSRTTSTEVPQKEETSLKLADEGTTLSASTGRVQSEATEVSSDNVSTTFATGEDHEDFTNGMSPFPSTPLSELLTDDTKSWTSTIKSDDSTAILTSTETSDYNPIQTTFYTSPLSQDPVNVEIKNSTTSSAEKRGKFIDDNYSSPNELHLPNNSDVWALAGMKSAGKVKSSELQNSVETSDEKAINNSMATKSLLDWTRVMMSTHAMETETTTKILENTTTEAPADKTTTELRTLQENEVETLTTKSPIEATTEVVKTVIFESTPQKEIEVDTKPPPKFETTTRLSDNEGKTIPERFTMDDTSLPHADDIMTTTKSSLNLLKGRDDAFIEDNKVDGDSIEEEQSSPTTTTTTTTTLLPNSVTMKSETTNTPVNGETTEEKNTGTISTSTLSLDFTTSMPFLTSTATTTTTTTIIATTTTPPPIVFNMGERTTEPPNMESTLTPSQSSPAEVAIAEQSLTTTTTTTTTTTAPAVTVMAATTETQTTEAHTPAIISSDDTMTQKSNNYNNYEVVNKTSTKFADNSSIEASEVSTRVSPFWAASTTEPSATEVDKLDEFDVTTAVNFDSNNNNAYEIATPEPSTTVGITLTVAPTTIPTTTVASSTSTSTEDLDHIESIHRISDTGETAIESNVIDPLQAGEASTTTTTKTTTRTTESSQENMRMQSTGRGEVDFSSTTTTTPRYDDDSTTTLQSISTKKEDVYSIVPTIDSGFHVPKLVVDDSTTTTVAGVLAAGVGAGGGGGQSMDSPDVQETDVNVIIAISVSVVGIVALILLVAFLYVMRKRQKQMSYGQRCRPVSLDAYSLDNVSVYNSVRRKGAALRASKRSYGNVAFDDPSLRHNVLGTHELAKYVEKKSSIWEEFKDVPQIIARADEVPAGCEDRNRYANVIPLPETRVILQQQNGDEKSEYINANYVRGPKDTTNYYIACQAPLDTTVTDFWRMIWEQNSRVIIMATDLIENGIDKCAEYLPPSVTLDNHTVFGDYQVTLKNREVKEKYAISTLMLKNTATEESREITHYWYQWPEAGVPTDEAAIIAMLLEARSSLKLYTIEQSDTKNDTIITDEKPTAKSEINGNVASEKPKQPPKDQGPLTIHCSPGTGRTGTILACDIAMRCLEEPKRSVDIPQIVYSVRRGRASAVQTKEQYEFIYKVTHMYATKISNLNNDN